VCFIGTAKISRRNCELPAGTYVVEAVESAPTLPPDEDRGLAEALASLRAGEGRTLDQVRQTIDSFVRR
jgi:hypothetical protein